MYGMVNRAIEKMVCEQHGPDVWSRIKSAAGVDVEAFLSLANYDDSVTFGLASAAAEELGLELPELLEAFGRYWIEFALQSSYGAILRQSGGSFAELLPALDQMHARLALSFPGLRPPSFRVIEHDGHLLKLRYESSRQGLAPFVVGLLHGLAKMFGSTVVVTHEEPFADNSVVFEVRYSEAE